MAHLRFGRQTRCRIYSVLERGQRRKNVPCLEEQPFDEDLMMCEDAEWAVRVLSAGATIAYVAEARVAHSHGYSLRSIFSRNFDYAVSLRDLPGSMGMSSYLRYLREELAFVRARAGVPLPCRGLPLLRRRAAPEYVLGARADRLPLWLLPRDERLSYLVPPSERDGRGLVVAEARVIGRSGANRRQSGRLDHAAPAHMIASYTNGSSVHREERHMTTEATTTITVRVPEHLRDEIDELAAAMGRNRQYVALEALRRYVAVESWQVARISEGIRAADAGEFASDDEVEVKLDQVRQPCRLMRIRWTAPALADLSILQEYIAEDSPVVAHRIVQDIRAEVANLPPFRNGPPGRVAETRELVVNKGRHVIAYRVRNQVIEIVGLIDARRQWPEGF